MLGRRWIHLVVLLLTISAGALAVAPSNDEATGATLISGLPYTTTQDTTSATVNVTDPSHSCTASQDSHTVWFRYVANFTGLLQVNTVGSGPDTVLTAYPGTTTPGAQLTCNDDAIGFTLLSGIGLNVASGQSYLIEVSSYHQTAGGSLVLNAFSNDEPANATLISGLPFSIFQDTSTATVNAADPLHTCTGSKNSKTVWFRYVATFTGLVQFSSAGSNYATVVTGYPGSTSPGAELACNNVLSNAQGVIGLNVVIGQSYLIEVSDLGALSGGRTLQLNADGAPTNDEAVGATAVSSPSFSTSENTITATANGSDPLHNCTGTRDWNTVWFRYVAPSTGRLLVNTVGSSYSTVLTAYPGSTIPGAELACASNGSQSTINLSTDSGQSYLIEASSLSPGGGTLILNAISCFYSISPSSQAFSASPGSGGVNVFTSTGCPWTATSNSSFLTITSPSSGSGNGSITYSVAANVGNARNGTMTLAEQNFGVGQAAAPTLIVTVPTPPGPFPNITLGSIPGSQLPTQTTVTVGPGAGSAPGQVAAIARFEDKGAGWLSVDKSTLTTLSTFKVTVAPNGLAPGAYTGSVSLQWAGTGTPFQEADIFVSVTVTGVAAPDLSGKTQAQAVTALQNASLVLGTVSQASSATVPVGGIISQNPAAGTQVAFGSAVNVTISTGPGTGVTSGKVLSHLVAGGEWTTGILVVNKGNSLGQFSIAFFGDTGQPIALPFSSGSTSVLAGSVPAQGSAYFEASNPNINFVAGWGKVTADPTVVIQAIFRRRVRTTFFYEAAVPTSVSATEFTFPFDATLFTDGSVPFYTGITFSNQDAAQIATVTCTARDTGGAVIPNAITVPPLAPLGHWADFLFPVLAGKRGTIKCTANTTVTTIPLRFIGVDAFSTLPVVDPNQVVTPGTRALSHLASGGEWTTGILVLNTGDAAAQYSIAFYGNTGLPVALPFSSGSNTVLTGSVPGRGSAYFEASNPNAPNSQVISAWGRVNADPSIVVQAIFRRNVAQTFYEAAVSSSLGSTSFIVPFDATIFSDANLPFYTGFAVANMDPTLAADITCVTRDSAGTLIPNAVTVPQLAPFGHWAEFLFPALTGKRGTITCTSNRTVATTVLRFIGVDGFSTLPIILP